VILTLHPAGFPAGSLSQPHSCPSTLNRKHNIKQPNMNTRQLNSRATLLTLLACGLTASPVLLAETDDFDNYSTTANFTAAGWVLSQMPNAVVTTTFSAAGAGKAIRVQSKPVLGEAPAVSIWYRSTEYTNFYMAVDLVGWANTNQAIALLARGDVGDDPGTSSGYLVNYDMAEYGDTPTSPRQGELQISILNPSFSTEQLALGEITLDPGKSYRMVFAGVDFHFTARIYDLLDLTTPLIQLEADDSTRTYTNGVCGLMAYNRTDTGASDVTLDNYEIATYDTNPATTPALAHPVAGTPTIETRVPAERFGSCYDPSGGIEFTASTYTSDIINASATKLRLNGLDVSSFLSLSANSSNISGSLPGSALSSHTIYSAQIEVQDVTGLKKSTNTFWFDTFSDDYLASGEVKIIEAEDYNYSNGVYQLDPITVSGPDTNGNQVAGNGIGYLDLHGVEGVDFHDSLTTPEALWAQEFRQFDPVGLSQGMFPEIEDSRDSYGETRYSDYVRSQYSTNGMLECVVHRTKAGEWLNYTRNFDGGIYNAWLRVASLGTTEVLLGRVTSNPASSGQTVTNLGKFTVPDQFTRYNYRFIPLADAAGVPVALSLSGISTLRLTLSGTAGQDDNKIAINYLLFVPATPIVHLFSAPTPGGPYVAETAAVVDAGNRSISVPTTDARRFYRLSSTTALKISGIYVAGGIVTITY